MISQHSRMQIAGEKGIVHDGNQAEKRESVGGAGGYCMSD